jgi:hypothetical protein
MSSQSPDATDKITETILELAEKYGKADWNAAALKDLASLPRKKVTSTKKRMPVKLPPCNLFI